ncbi:MULTISPECIES: DJ-1/PfpI family protein [Paenibacillus]|jgi:protease I|uniref:DJ-1/PfpI family protein n=1 Tax=Paenibacillus baimaensis TaxID=2982185 RepID=A0ABT2USS7_9BACL|nr:MULTISPECIES: DJ-1/PfpI family protein [unclassified Paenibacillus]MCU6797670.1 DJ-1/PfpI family protein [Paenibacillus sp. WQ 127069]OMF20180.1 peptidase [Paenibacillus sp. FSL H7-0331]
MSKKVLFITGDAVESLEIYYPYYRVLEEGYEAVIASPTKKVLRTVVHDFEGWDTYTEKPGYQLESHIAFDQVDPTEYDGLIIPGGRAPEYIRLNENIPRIVSHFFEANKPVGAICHAVLVLNALKSNQYFEGKTMTAYTACRPDVENLGAIYSSETLQVDGNIVSGHAWPDLPGFMREFLRLLK